MPRGKQKPENAAARAAGHATPAQLRAALKWWRKNHAKKLREKRTPAARALLPPLTKNEALDAGLSVVARKHPRVFWMGLDGRLHREDTRSAEQVIADYVRSKVNKPKGKTP